MKTKNEKHETFLEFDGKKILFLSVDGTYWIALKPILNALKMDADRVIKTTKNDPFLGGYTSIQAVQVSKNGIIQGRNMTCLPEKYIYGWICFLRGESEELQKYKETCYNLLYDHFHGVITNQKELLQTRSSISTRIHNLQSELKEEEDRFKQIGELKQQLTAINKKLNSNDKEYAKEPDLWQQE